MLNNKLVLLKKIRQVDNHHFVIEWSDRLSMKYRLSDLQINCPCAGCSEDRAKGKLVVDETVKAIRISSVGRYALRVQFTRGCSAGIYDYSLLRSIGQEFKCESPNC